MTIALSSSDLTEGTVCAGVDDVHFRELECCANGDGHWSRRSARRRDRCVHNRDGRSESTDPAYNGMTVADVSVSTTDNDSASVTVTPTSGLVTTEAGGSATFTVVLTSQPTANVTIPLSSSDLTEGTVSPASVTFTSANWNVAQTVTVTGVDALSRRDGRLHDHYRSGDQHRPRIQQYGGGRRVGLDSG